MNASLPARIRIQNFIGWLLLLPFCGLVALAFRFLGRYSIEDVKTIRRQFRELATEGLPILACGNHLTFVDSALLIWVFAPLSWYTLNYRFFTWNLPAGDFFSKNIFYRSVAYISKCVFIHRNGSLRHKAEIFSIARNLVKNGNLITIFPEGRRSRTGNFEGHKLTHGAGRIVAQVPDCRVLCFYLRSHLQERHTSYPPRGSHFLLKMKLIRPYDAPGPITYKEVTQQIGETIIELEREYFASRGASRFPRGASPVNNSYDEIVRLGRSQPPVSDGNTPEAHALDKGDSGDRGRTHFTSPFSEQPNPTSPGA